jgi:hypothetical protein
MLLVSIGKHLGMFVDRVQIQERKQISAARVEEILAAGAERAEITVEQVLRELAVLGFSDIGKVVRWRPVGGVACLYGLRNRFHPDALPIWSRGRPFHSPRPD